MMVDVQYGCAVSVVFVRALLELFPVALLLGISPDVSLGAKTKRADDGKRHLPHTEQGRHGAEVSLEGEVHQCGMYDVVLMMPECNLVASYLLGKVEELLATLPGAEETRRFRLLSRVES
jgi:hypothetical protein